jgi:hypothetical protein
LNFGFPTELFSNPIWSEFWTWVDNQRECAAVAGDIDSWSVQGRAGGDQKDFEEKGEKCLRISRGMVEEFRVEFEEEFDTASVQDDVNLQGSEVDLQIFAANSIFLPLKLPNILTASFTSTKNPISTQFPINFLRIYRYSPLSLPTD